jgi:hypothetical protein
VPVRTAFFAASAASPSSGRRAGSQPSPSPVPTIAASHAGERGAHRRGGEAERVGELVGAGLERRAGGADGPVARGVQPLVGGAHGGDGAPRPAASNRVSRHPLVELRAASRAGGRSRQPTARVGARPAGRWVHERHLHSRVYRRCGARRPPRSSFAQDLALLVRRHVAAYVTPATPPPGSPARRGKERPRRDHSSSLPDR